MTFAAPLWLVAAAAVGIGVLVAHLFRTTVPPQDLLPTVRFIPESTPLTVLRSRRLSDVALLLLRLAIVALLGLALAGPHVRRRAPDRVVVLDASRAVGALPVAVDSAIAAASGHAVLIAFDSAARVLTPDSARRLVASGAQGSVSGALAAAHRIVAQKDARESTELVVVSPLVSEEVDSATAALFALWAGPIRVVRVRPADDVEAEPVWEVRARGDDPVAAALAGMPNRRPETVRVVRVTPSAADSQWARTSGGALVIWPSRDVRGVLTPRTPADTQGGVAAGAFVAIAPFVREANPRDGRVVARWTDGAAASTERPLGGGCVREVAIPVDAIGDLALRDGFRGIVNALLEPCGGRRDLRLVETATLVPGTRPAASGDAASAAATPQGGTTSLPFWLAIGALVALGLEQLLRPRSTRTAVA